VLQCSIHIFQMYSLWFCTCHWPWFSLLHIHTCCKADHTRDFTLWVRNYFSIYSVKCFTLKLNLIRGVFYLMHLKTLVKFDFIIWDEDCVRPVWTENKYCRQLLVYTLLSLLNSFHTLIDYLESYTLILSSHVFLGFPSSLLYRFIDENSCAQSLPVCYMSISSSLI
jgi:hypothetical protein